MNKANSKTKFKPRCCPHCADYMFCNKQSKVLVFRDRGFDIIWMLTGQLLDEGRKKCEASQKECFKEKL